MSHLKGELDDGPGSTDWVGSMRKLFGSCGSSSSSTPTLKFSSSARNGVRTSTVSNIWSERIFNNKHSEFQLNVLTMADTHVAAIAVAPVLPANDKMKLFGRLAQHRPVASKRFAWMWVVPTACAATFDTSDCTIFLDNFQDVPLRHHRWHTVKLDHLIGPIIIMIEVISSEWVNGIVIVMNNFSHLIRLGSKCCHLPQNDAETEYITTAGKNAIF